MTQIPANPVTQADLNEWSALHAQLSALKSAEMLLRMKIFKGLFDAPVEGTNTLPLGTEGWVIKAKYPINRKPDVALLVAKAQEMRELGIPVDSLIKSVPELVTTEYRKLSDEQRNVFDQILDIKPGSPALEIVLPKRAAKD